MASEDLTGRVATAFGTFSGDGRFRGRPAFVLSVNRFANWVDLISSLIPDPKSLAIPIKVLSHRRPLLTVRYDPGTRPHTTPDALGSSSRTCLHVPDEDRVFILGALSRL